MEADADGSHSLEWKETFILSLAMSLDSLAAGAAAALSEGRIALTVLLSLLVGTAVTEAGLMAGRFAAGKGPGMAQRSAFDSGGDWEAVGGRKLLVKMYT